VLLQRHGRRLPPAVRAHRRAQRRGDARRQALSAGRRPIESLAFPGDRLVEPYDSTDRLDNIEAVFERMKAGAIDGRVVMTLQALATPQPAASGGTACTAGSWAEFAARLLVGLR
jgi:hypothetical protein